MQIKAVVLDYGNVLSLNPGPADYQVLQRMTEIEEDAFNLLYWRYRLDYDRDLLDATGYWRRIGEESGRRFSAGKILELIACDLELWTRVEPTMIAWVSALKESALRTALLSNMPRQFSTYLRSSADWLRHFDHLVFSGEIGILKPEAAIYRACLEGLGAKPEESLFIDDQLPNVEAARAIGMPALTFQSLEQLARAIQPYGLPPVVLSAGDGRRP
jgi:putative hydrolase of the HAD superfamily